MPDYDYIEDEDDTKASTTANVHSHGSTPGISIYNIPQGGTLKFINQRNGTCTVENQTPTPYEVPNETIYEDPGVQKEKIYEWLDKKKFRKLKRTEIT